MQVDTGSYITLTPVNIWQELGKPRLKKSTLELKQFDDTVIKTLGTFEVTSKLALTTGCVRIRFPGRVSKPLVTKWQIWNTFRKSI